MAELLDGGAHGLVMAYGGCYGRDCGPSLPWWVPVLIVLAIAVMIALIGRHKGRVLRDRADAVRTAVASTAPEDSAFSVENVRKAAAALFAEALAASDAHDAERLAAVMDAGAAKTFGKLLNAGDRRAALKQVRRTEYVGLDRGADRVVVYIAARIRVYAESSGASKRQGGAGATKVLFLYLTLVRRDGRWVATAIERSGAGEHHLSEPIVATAPARYDRTAYAEFADRIEQELREFGAWSGDPADGAVHGPFGAPNRSFSQWLQYELIPNVREIAAGRAEPRATSMVGTQAIREYDGFTAADPLIDVLLELDRRSEDDAARAAPA